MIAFWRSSRVNDRDVTLDSGPSCCWTLSGVGCGINWLHRGWECQVVGEWYLPLLLLRMLSLLLLPLPTLQHSPGKGLSPAAWWFWFL